MSKKVTGTDLEKLIKEAMMETEKRKKGKDPSKDDTKDGEEKPSVEDAEKTASLSRVNIANLQMVKKLGQDTPATVKRMYALAKARLAGDERRKEEKAAAEKAEKDAAKKAAAAAQKAEVDAEKEELKQFLNSVDVTYNSNASLNTLKRLKANYEKNQATESGSDTADEEVTSINESQEDSNIYYFDKSSGTIFTEVANERIFTLSEEEFRYLVSSSDILTAANPRPLDSDSDIGRIFFTTEKPIADLNALNVEFTPDIAPAFLHDLATPLSQTNAYYRQNKFLNPTATSNKDFRIAKHKIIMHFYKNQKNNAISSLQSLALLAGDGKILNDDDITSFLMSTDEEVVQKIGNGNISLPTVQNIRKALKQTLRTISQLTYPRDKDFTSMGLGNNEKLTSKQFAELKTTARAHLARAKGEEVRKSDPSRARPDVRLSKKYKGYAVLESTPQYVLDIFQNSGVTTGNSLRERLEKLTNLTKSIFKDKESQLDLAEAVASDNNDSIEANFSDLMLFDFFKKIAYDLGPQKSAKDAGFYFETFLALLSGGTVEGGGSNVEDIIMPPSMKGDEDSVFVSAKLISENTQIAQAGSTVNNFFNKHGAEAKFIYVVAYKLKFKEGERMTTAEFPVFVKTYSKSDFPDLESPDGDGVYRSASGVTFYPPGDFKAPAAKSFKYKKDQASIFGDDNDTGGKDDFDPSVSFKDSQASGTYVFEIEQMRTTENLVGTILIPADIKEYNNRINESFESLNLNIKNTYSKLEKFEESLVSFYSSAGREQSGQASTPTADKGKEAEDSFIALKKEVSTSLEKGGYTTSNLQESKITADFLKKLISESFKK